MNFDLSGFYYNLSGFYYKCFAEPALQPAGLLIAILAVYWSLVMFGAIDLEFLDWNFEFSLEGDSGALDFGLVPLRFLNLGTIPVMLWMTVFGFSAWMLSLLIHYRWAPDQADGVVVAEAFGLAMLVTKLATNPFRSVFEIVEPNRPETLIGQTCTISTLTATSLSGEAHFTSEGAPLILSVRVSDGDLSKGQTTKIIDYNLSDNTYIVSGTIEGDE